MKYNIEYVNYSIHIFIYILTYTPLVYTLYTSC